MNTTPPPGGGFDSPLIHKTYRLYLLFYHCQSILPKQARYTLGTKISQSLLELLELIIQARTKQGKSRILMIQKADFKVKILKLFVRLLYDAKEIDQKQYIRLEGQLIEIGKLIGGWLKALENKKT